MTYGRWLDDAAGALAAAVDAARHTKATGHTDAAAVAAARHRLYHGLGRLTRLICGVTAPPTTPGQADLLVNTNRRMNHTDPAVILAAALRAAAAPSYPAARNVSPLGYRLAEAADAIATAGDILASHLNPGARPRTPEGMALHRGAGRTGGLADVARLAHAALQADRHLPAWLGRIDPTLRTLYQPIIDTTRWWTRSRYPAVLQAIAAQASGTSVLRMLDVAPPSSRTGDPRYIARLDDVADTLDITRAWLTEHSRRATAGHVAAAARLATAVCAATAVASDDSPPRDATRALARWRAVSQAFDEIADLGGAGDPAVIYRCDAAAEWLTRRTRDKSAIHPQWKDAVSDLRNKLPGLAEAGRTAMVHAVACGGVCVKVFPPELELCFERRGLIYYATGRWQRAGVDDPAVSDILAKLRMATKRATDADNPAEEHEVARLARVSFAATTAPARQAPGAHAPSNSPAQDPWRLDRRRTLVR